MRREKKPIPVYWWPIWMATLGLALVVFYVILTPLWMGIRLIAWLSERGSAVFAPPEGGR